MNARLCLMIVALALTATSLGKQAGKSVEYKDGETTLEGYIASPATKGKKPAVLIVHDWNGLDRYEESRADQIAGLGYIGFSVDIYGKGVRPKTVQECSAEAGKYYQNNSMLRARIAAALAFIKKQPNVDSSRIAVMGYCFGGMTAIDTARSGANVKGVISFHGSLGTQNPAQKGKLKAEILVCHGLADTLVPQKDIDAFHSEMKAADATYKFLNYPDAKHSFTVPGSDRAGISGVGYNAAADKKSWEDMRSFLARIFKK